MKGLIVSSNPLFIEVVSEALTRYFADGYVLVNPEYAPERLYQLEPDLILIDDSVRQDQLIKTLNAARQLKQAHIVLINPGDNDCVVVKSYRANLTNLEDFMSVIVKETVQEETSVQDNSYAQMQENALDRAGMYNFLASILNHRPDANLVRNLHAVGIKTFMNILGTEGISPDLESGLSLMAAFVQQSSGHPEALVEQDLAVDWTRLFRGVQPGYGPPPPYEAEYLAGRTDPSKILQTLMREYAEAGARIDSSAGNRPDYLGLELAFVGFLASSEAEAWKINDVTRATEFASSAQAFVRRHPGAWGQRFCEKALPEARTDFYRGYLQILGTILQE